MSLRVLIVCTANVCRSPMAAALLDAHCRQFHVDAVVASAGTEATNVPVDPLAVDALTAFGRDISQHLPRRLTREMLATEGKELILAMTRDHLRAAATMATGAFGRTFTLREFVRRVAEREPEVGEGLDSWLASVADDRRARDLIGPDVGDDILDPYGSSLDAHRRCAEELDRLTERVATTLAILANHSSRSTN